MIGESVYKALNTEITIAQSTSAKDKGRSKELLKKRNAFLIHRFYFKSKIQKKLYPDVIRELSQELHLSEIMVQKILVEKADEVLRLKKEALSVDKLRQLWSWWRWDVKEKPAA